MYNNVYQDYINSIIGTPHRNAINFGENTYNNFEQSEYFQYQNANSNLEQLYPELYKLIYPMVQAACMRNTKPITKECIDEMVEEIYTNFITEETETGNLSNDVRSKTSSESKNSAKTTLSSKSSSKDLVENRQVGTRQRNPILNDLIRILLIRELLGRPGNVFPRPPSRPPFPRPERPPFRNEINLNMQDNSIYEKPINMYSNFNEGYNIF